MFCRLKNRSMGQPHVVRISLSVISLRHSFPSVCIKLLTSIISRPFLGWLRCTQFFYTKWYQCDTNQTVFQSEEEHMADDLNEFDDPEQSYRRGYVHGAREVLAAIERRLPTDQRAMIEGRLGGELSKWRLESLRGKTGRNKTGLTGNMGPPRLLILD